MKTELLLASVLLLSLVGCKQAEDRRIAELERQVKELQNETASRTWVSNCFFVVGGSLDSLDRDIKRLRLDADWRAILEQNRHVVRLDPTQKSYQRLETENGALMVAFDSMEPYLDGYRVTLQIGNPSLLTYAGFEATTTWGPSWEGGQTNSNTADITHWQSLQHTNVVRLTDRLLPGTWNYVNLVIAPAKPDEIRNLELFIKTDSISLTPGIKSKY